MFVLNLRQNKKKLNEKKARAHKHVHTAAYASKKNIKTNSLNREIFGQKQTTTSSRSNNWRKNSNSRYNNNVHIAYTHITLHFTKSMERRKKN